MANLTLVVLNGTFAICRLAADAPVPAWATGGLFLSVSRTADELSIVCRQEVVPEGILCERSWRCLRVAGTLDFSLVGVPAWLLGPLAAAGVSVFVVSTFDTDYLLLKDRDLETAVEVLEEAGHGVCR
jgi:hypothetical protein